MVERKPHAFDTPTHIWLKEDRHWTPREEFARDQAMCERETRIKYVRWARQDTIDKRRANQKD